jgi:hypothetical protein
MHMACVCGAARQLMARTVGHITAERLVLYAEMVPAKGKGLQIGLVDEVVEAGKARAALLCMLVLSL